MYFHRVNPVKEILPEFVSANHLGKIHVGGANQPDIDRNRFA